MKLFRYFEFAFVLLCVTPPMHARAKTAIIDTYSLGWENRNQTTTAGLLTDGFTFTTANNADHISTAQFKDKCRVEAEHIRRFEFTRSIEQGEEACIGYRCFTKNNKTFTNTEYFTFSKGTIKSIEVFFGTGQGFPSNEKQ